MLATRPPSQCTTFASEATNATVMLERRASLGQPAGRLAREPAQLGRDARVVGVDPGPLVGREEVDVDQPPVDRAERERPEAQQLALAAFGLRPLLDGDEVLDPDPVGVQLVIARLVADDHADFERHAPALLADAWRPLVDAEIGADAVAGAVVEVEPGAPQRHPGQRVELGAAGAL